MKKEDLLDRMIAVCREKKLFSPGDGLLIACSGGVDSVVLTDLLCRMQQDWNLRLCVAHFEHGIRGTESAADADFVKQLACSRHLPFYMRSENVPAFAGEQHLSIETAARERRYAFLRSICRELELDGILLAHHADDQAETVLMHILRGAGMDGLSAMSYRQKDLIRPMLSFRKEELLEYSRERGLDFCEDRTNLVPDTMRNKLRLELLPLLEQEYHSSVGDHLCRLADIAAEEQDYLRQVLLSVLPKVIREGEPPELSGEIFLELHPAIQRLVLRHYLQSVFGDILDLEYQHIEALRRLLKKGQTGSCLTLPRNRKVKLSYGWLHPVFPETRDLREYPLCIPGILALSAYGMTVHAEIRTSLPEHTDSMEFYCAFDQLPEPPVIRTRRPGDRIVTAAGTRKLKDYFIDCKLRKELRDLQPLLVSGENVLWVIGKKRSSLFRPESGERILCLKVDRKGDANHDDGQ